MSDAPDLRKPASDQQGHEAAPPHEAGPPHEAEPRHEGPLAAIAHDHRLIAEELEELAKEASDTGAVLRSDERPSMIDLMGGPLGIAETAIPTLAFVIATTAGAEINRAAIIAVSFAALLAFARIARRQTPQFALAGVLGVAISAFIASKTGEARDFFALGLLANIGYAAGAFASAALKHPFVGYLVEGIGGDDMTAWRRDRHKLRAYRIASMVIGSVFVIRLAVQVPLYLADQVTALGTARIVMGVPLLGLGVWISWLVIRQARQASEAEAPTA